MGKLLDQFRRAVRDLVPTRRQSRERMRAVGEAWAEEVRKRLPPSLRAGVRWEQTGDTRGELILPRVAWYREKGTRKHTIRPRNRKALAFQWGAPNAPHTKGRPGAGPGQYAFGKVEHPGTRPRPFLDDAWRSPAVREALRALGGEVTRTER